MRSSLNRFLPPLRAVFYDNLSRRGVSSLHSGESSIDALVDRIRRRDLARPSLPRTDSPPDDGLSVIDLDAELMLYGAGEAEGALRDSSAFRGADGADAEGNFGYGDGIALGDFTAGTRNGEFGESNKFRKKSAEELANEVSDSINSMCAKFEERSEALHGEKDENTSFEETEKMTPAQIFLRENKERLMKKAKEFYVQREMREISTDEEEDQWAYYEVRAWKFVKLSSIRLR